MGVLNKILGIIFSIITVISACFVLFLVSSLAHCETLEIEDLTIKYINYFPGGVDPLLTQNGLPNRTVGQDLQLSLSTSIYDHVYWDSIVHSGTDRIFADNGDTVPGQFRTVGLIMRLGLNLTDSTQLGLFHHSQHLLDTTYAHGPFPRLDGIELKINLYRSRYRPKGLF